MAPLLQPLPRLTGGPPNSPRETEAEARAGAGAGMRSRSNILVDAGGGGGQGPSFLLHSSPPKGPEAPSPDAP